MSFDPLQFTAFVASSDSTLWFYDTQDSRAQVLAPNYFAPAPQLLSDGDIIICHAADALMFLPVLDDTHVGSGLVLDAFQRPLQLTTRADQRFAPVQSITPIARIITLDTIPGSMLLGRSLTVRAFVTGPVTSVTFRLLNAANAILDTVVASVSGGSATATFTPTALGSYRIRATVTDDAAATLRSALFVVTEPFALLRENGGGLLAQNGDELLI